MLTREVLSQHLPSLHLHDKVYQALQLMNDNQITHLPVLDGEKFAGLLSEDDLLQSENDHALLSALEQSFSSFSVKEEDHFLKAVQLAADNGLSLVPVINEENVLEMESNQYSFNEISKLVETNDAQITQLNTSNDAETGTMQVTLRINKTEISDILATFQRYEYNVKYFFGEEQYANELRSNYDNLMNYLKI